MLGPALEALKSGDEERALERLVEAWRSTRAPEVAALVDLLGERLDGALPPIAGKLADFQRAWLAVAARRRAVDLPRLVKSILHTTQQSGVAITQALLARGEALASWPVDPRLSLAIATHLRAGPFNATGKAQQPFWTKVFELTLAQDDARAIEAFAALDFAKIWKGWNDVRARIAFLQPAVNRVVAELRRRHPSETPAPAPALASANEREARDVRAAIDALGPVDASRLAAALPEPARATPKNTKPSAPLDARGAMPALAAAEHALTANDDERALEALLEAWRTTRAPSIGELIGAVSKRVESRLAPITGDTRKAIHDAWLAIASKRRAADLPRLLASITHTSRRATDALARLEAIGDWPPDPRAAAGVVANLEEIPFHTSSTKPFWTAMIRFAVQHGDHGTAEALEAVAKRLGTILHAQYTDLGPIRTWFRNQIGAAVSELRARPAAPLDDDIARTIDRISKTLGAHAAPADRLFAAVAASPDDDEPRHVLGDHLQELGDPRGELIALQLNGAHPERAAALVDRHIAGWLGPLARIARAESCVWERGFLSEVHLRGVPVEAVNETAGDPIWSTVHRLTLAHDQPLPEAFLRQPSTRAIEHLGLREPAQIAALMEWQAVPYRSLGFDCRLGAAERRAISGAGRKLAKLRAIELGGIWIESPKEAEFLLDSPTGRQLEEVAVTDSVDALDKWLARLAKTHVRRFRWYVAVRGAGSLELTRDGKGAFSIAHATLGAQLSMIRLAQVVPSLKSLRELRISGGSPTKTDRARLEKALPRMAKIV